jgi:hypothetical protein
MCRTGGNYGKNRFTLQFRYIRRQVSLKDRLCKDLSVDFYRLHKIKKLNTPTALKNLADGL